MVNARTLYMYSPEDSGRADLEKFVEDLGRTRGIPQQQLTSLEELKGKLEGGQAKYVLIDGDDVGPKLLEALGEPQPEKLLALSLAELEKRHILRVLASTGGNKTRAARSLGIDTKTLYNKLKSYQVSESARKRRLEKSAQT